MKLLSVNAPGVLRGSVVKCLSQNPEVLRLSCTGPSGSVLQQDNSVPQPSTGETQNRKKRHE